MTELDRRTFTKFAGASLLGLTVSGSANANNPDNTGVPLLEAWPSFRFGDVENLEETHSDGPVKYTINAEEEVLNLRAVTNDEAKAATTGERLVNFRGIRSDVDSIGGVTLNALFCQDEIGKTRSTYVSAVGGYRMPEIDINWNGNERSQLLTSDKIRDVKAKNGFFRLRLPSQEVEVQQKIVGDELVDDDSIPERKRSVVIDRPTTNVEVNPYLTVAFHPSLDVVGNV
jgi:hypothetical protein